MTAAPTRPIPPPKPASPPPPASSSAAVATQMHRGERRRSSTTRRLTVLGVALPTMVVTAVAAMIQLGLGDDAFMAPFIIGPAESYILLGLIAGFSFLVANAVFAVSDRANVRAYGLVAANGATAAQLRHLAFRRSLVPGLTGLAIGAVSGLLTGAAIMWWLDAFTPGWMLTGYTVASVLFYLVPMLVGVWLGALLPAHQVARRSIMAALGGRDQPLPATAVAAGGSSAARANHPSRAGFLLLVASLAATTVFAAAFNHLPVWSWTPDWLREQVFLLADSYPVYLGLTLSTIGVIVGLVMVLPQLFKRLADGVDGGPAWLRLGLDNLARNRGRAGVAAGSLVVLAAGAVMAVAGIESDLESDIDANPPPADSRYVQVFGARPEPNRAISEALNADPNAGLVTTAEFRTVPLTFLLSDQEAFASWSKQSVAILNDDLVDALDLDPALVRAAEGGLVLRNTDRRQPQPAITTDVDQLLDVRDINHGEGGDLALAYLVAPGLADDIAATSTQGHLHTIFVTERRVTAQTHDQLREIGSEYSLGVSITGPGDPITARQGQWILIAVAAGLALVVGWVSSASARQSEAGTRATMGDLGMRPTDRWTMLAAEVGVQQALAGLLGGGLGVILFRLVTLGDPSVPGLIVPWVAIGIFALAVPVAIVLLVAVTGRGS